MKNILIFIAFFTLTINVYSQSSDDLFKLGETAFIEEEYPKAVDYFKKAANLGSSEACGYLAFMYYYGAVPSIKNGNAIIRDTEMASLWANRAGEQNSLRADIVLALINYYEGNFKETIRILTVWKEEFLFPEAKLALAISYMVSGNNLYQFAMRDKAEKLVKSVYDATKKDIEKSLYFYISCAILAKLELQKNWDIENPKIYKYLDKCEVDDVFCPLAAYMWGNILSHIADADKKQLSLEYLKYAIDEIISNEAYEILYPFANEIISTYNTLKNQSK